MSNLPPTGQPIYRPSNKSTSPIIILVALLACSVPMLGILAGLLLPAIQQAREAARRMSCSSNVRQIGIALLGYEYSYKQLPPAYTVDSDGNKLHSWRTLILPFMEQQALYSSIDFSKPWNDPVNALLVEANVPAYHCPSLSIQKNLTTYKVVVDPKSLFPGSTGVRLGSVTDGTSNTLLVFESDVTSAVPWMAPEDASMQEFVAIGTGTASKTAHFGGIHAVMADNAVRFLPNQLDTAAKHAMVTIDGGEPVTQQIPY